MSSFEIALAASATVFVVILATDLGRRRVTTTRMARSLIAVALIVALFVHSLPTAGNDVSLQLIGTGVGVIFGLVAGVLLPAERAASGEVYTRGGVAYAALWFVLSSARVVFAYGAEHWFPQGLVAFSIEHQLSGADVYANAFVFMSLAMVLARTAVLLTRRNRLLAQAHTGTALPGDDARPAAGTAPR